MKKVFILLLCLVFVFSGCANNIDYLKKGDEFSATGMVGYSDSPSDIGSEYCYITVGEKIKYYYIDIYDEESEWESNEFYTLNEKDTELLKGYIGKEVTVSGSFDAESHGIPYITNITVQEN